MTLFDDVPKRLWVTSGLVACLCSGMVAASAGAASVAGVKAQAGPASHGRLLAIQFAAEPPLVMPGPPAEGDRLAVLSATPANLADLDPDLQAGAGLYQLQQSEARYQRLLAAEATALSVPAYDARPLPDALATAPDRAAAHEDDVAASGDTAHAAQPETPPAG